MKIHKVWISSTLRWRGASVNISRHRRQIVTGAESMRDGRRVNSG